jgi:hypothetical protein
MVYIQIQYCLQVQQGEGEKLQREKREWRSMGDPRKKKEGQNFVKAGAAAVLTSDETLMGFHIFTLIGLIRLNFVRPHGSILPLFVQPQIGACVCCNPIQPNPYVT